MVKVGITINILGALVITAFFYFIATVIFSINPGMFPDWAQQIGSADQQIVTKANTLTHREG